MIIFMCSEVESSGLKAITVYCGSMYSMFACQASILHFAKIYRAECFVQRVPSSPRQAFDILQNTWGRKILENKILTQLQTNVSKT